MLLVLATLLPTGFLASRLSLRTEFTELLPDGKRSVIEARRIAERLSGKSSPGAGSGSTLSVVAKSENVDALKRFVDSLAPQIRKLDPKLVTSVQDGSREVQDFFRAHKHLYADLSDIQQIHDDVIDRYDYEVQKKGGMDLGLDDAENTSGAAASKADVPPPLDAQALEDRFKKKIEEAQKQQPGTDGYYIGKSNGQTYGVILVRSPLNSMDPVAFELRSQIQKLVSAIHPQAWDPKLTVGYSGNLLTTAEAKHEITQDLVQIGGAGVAMILAAILLFFLRFRVLACMGLTILVGCTWSFAGAYLGIGYLNLASGLMVSIITGNGINFGIIYMARYIEARRAQESISEAILTAHRETHIATLAAAAAAMVAYGSLAVTNFRGFKHFGAIGGMGMTLCWLATYLLLPALLAITERFRPMFGRGPSWRSKARGFYGYPFVWAAEHAPRAIALFGILSGVLTIAVSVRYFVQDPMEYNLRTVLGGKAHRQTEAGALAGRVDDVVGRAGQDGRAIVVDRVDQVQPLVTALMKRRDAVAWPERPFEKVVTVFDILPKEQAKKIQLLNIIRDRVERGHKRGFVSDTDYAKISEYIPSQLAPIEMADLPDAIARPFIDHDGVRGRIVYIVPTAGQSIYNARYLQRWADAFRETRLPNGEVIYGSGDPVIFADVLQSIREEAPKAILLSFLGTLAVIFLAFRGSKNGLLTLSVLAVGLSWMIAFLAFDQIKLNFLNFVALPISIGVGADYALNIMKRSELTDVQSLPKALVETGGAVVLCSLTTTLGYVALMFSMNGATESFGLTAAAGEVTTLLAAVLLLPAILFWMNKRKANQPA
ncbi:MAG TPA: MMPL family transporter [Polyangiaceae bacterium]